MLPLGKFFKVGLGKFLPHRETIMSDIKHKVEQIRLHLVNRKDVLIYYRQFGHRIRNDTPTMWGLSRLTSGR
ncbi:ATP synthase F0, B subunit domain protein [Rothia aeria F0184]|nr:ATP synthase F0, B subunit domain protein [Rothia aeria F0184]